MRQLAEPSKEFEEPEREIVPLVLTETAAEKQAGNAFRLLPHPNLHCSGLLTRMAIFKKGLPTFRLLRACS